jgi:hypothetical protein
MSRREINQAVSAANPIDPSGVRPRPLEEAERELLAAIVAEPQGEALGSATSLAGGSAWRRRITIRYLAMVAAGACAIAAVFLLGGGGGATGPPASAYAAELARIAKHSKVVVFDPATGPDKRWSVRSPDGAAKQPSAQQGYRKWVVVRMVWDCTELPCVKRSAEEMKRAGIALPELKSGWSRDVEVVIPPSGAE